MNTTVSFVANERDMEHIEFLIKDMQRDTPSSLKWRRSDVIRYALDNLYMLRSQQAGDVGAR